MASSETQGQIVGAKESLNGRRQKSAKKLPSLDFSSPIFVVVRLDFPSPPLSAPGSPRMLIWEKLKTIIYAFYIIEIFSTWTDSSLRPYYLWRLARTLLCFF